MTEIYEILETVDGDFVLQRADSSEEPLVTIKFSSEALKFLSDASGDIAKIMIEAGIHEVEDMMAAAMEDDAENFDDAEEKTKPLVH